MRKGLSRTLTKKGVHELQGREEVVAPLAISRLHDARVAEASAHVAAAHL